MTDRIRETFQGISPGEWANGKTGWMRYDSAKIWYKFAGLHYEGTTPRADHDEINGRDDIVKFPIVAKGITAYIIRRMGRASGEKIYTDYYEACLLKFKDIEKLKPDAFERNLDSEFYSIHLSDEHENMDKSEVVFSYTTIEETEQIGKFVKKYFEYIKKNHCPDNKNNDVPITESDKIDKPIDIPISTIIEIEKLNIKINFKYRNQFKNIIEELSGSQKNPIEVNDKEFTAIASILYNVGWISKDITFIDWLRTFSGACHRLKVPSYKETQVKTSIQKIIIKAPFLDNIKIK